MRGCFERNGSAQNGTKRTCKREASVPTRNGSIQNRSKVPCKRSLRQARTVRTSDVGWFVCALDKGVFGALAGNFNR